MEKSQKDLFKDKIALVYEFNKNSSVFAHAADIELERNNYEKAILILSEGIPLFPRYASGYIVLGKALTLYGDFEKAEKAFRKGSSLLNSNSTYERYSFRIEELRGKSSKPLDNKISVFLHDHVAHLLEREETEIDEKGEVEKLIELKPSGELDLDILAEKLQNAKLPLEENERIESPSQIIGDDEDINLESSGLVSETLASIYISQSNYREAIQIYQKLLQKNPEKSEVFQRKIDELNSKLEGGI